MCSDDTENMQGISTPSLSPPPCCKSFEYRRLSFTYISTPPPYLMEKCILLQYVFSSMPTSLFRFYLYTQLNTYHVREKTIHLQYWHSKFCKFNLPVVLKKVEPTNARLYLKCFYDNQRDFFIYVQQIQGWFSMMAF